MTSLLRFSVTELEFTHGCRMSRSWIWKSPDLAVRCGLADHLRRGASGGASPSPQVLAGEPLIEERGLASRSLGSGLASRSLDSSA